MSRGMPKAGDIVMTTEAPLGEIAQLDSRKIALAQRLITLRGKPEILNSKFLKFLMQSELVQYQLHSRASGTTVTGIKQSELRKIVLMLPPLSEQKAIAHILGSLDDKIELNRRMNKTLEDIARAIFKSWFVDFDPVKAKMEGRTPAGVPEEIIDLFPDKLEESELGLKPEGWKITMIDEIANVVKGRSYKSSELSESDTALVTLKSFQRGGGYRTDGLKSYIGEYKPEQIVKSGELIVAFTDVTQAAEVIGKPAIVKKSNTYDKLVASLDVGIIRPTVDDISIPFFYFLFMTEFFQSHIYGYCNGTTVLHLSKQAIPNFTFIRPSKIIGLKYKELTTPLFRKIEMNSIEINTLILVRDTLLPKLISGQIRIIDI